MTSSPSVQVVGFESLTIDVEGRLVEYLEAGHGLPLLVLHGAPGLAANMSPAVATLAQTYRVIAPNLPGIGGGPGDGIKSFRDMAAFAFAFISALDLDPVSVLGTSVGGYAALWLAVDHPESVRRLVLEAPAAFRSGPPPPAPPAGGPHGAQPGVPSSGGVGRQSHLDHERMRFVMDIAGPDTDEALVAAMPTCEVMTLVLLGQKDPMFPPSLASQYKQLPASTVSIVYDAGHDIKGERPEAFVSVVLDYLDRGQAFVVQTESARRYA